MLQWFATARSEQFGRELAEFILADLERSTHRGQSKFAAKADKTLQNAAVRVTVFKRAERLNFHKKARLANAFLWTLKDAGCEEGYANTLTDWLTQRL
jgi:hypothetical protein